jgi:hypothetical protein
VAQSAKAEPKSQRNAVSWVTKSATNLLYHLRL